MQKLGRPWGIALCLVLLHLRSAADDPVKPAPAPADEAERAKAENTRATEANELIARAQAALSGKKWAEAAELLQPLIAADPKRWEFRQSLGGALLNLGKYDEARAAYHDGAALAQAELVTAKPGDAARQLAQQAGRMLAAEGNCFVKLGKSDEGIACFRQAAELDPDPGTAFFNLAATCYNAGRMDDALTYCNKTIAADPARADAYFIKGSVLMGNGSADKTGKITFPPGTVEALQKYLELKPDGPHAGDVKAMLDYVVSETAAKK